MDRRKRVAVKDGDVDRWQVTRMVIGELQAAVPLKRHIFREQKELWSLILPVHPKILPRRTIKTL